MGGWATGYAAYWQGVEEDRNPYDETDPESGRWQEGWRAAEAGHERQKNALAEGKK